MKYFTKYTALIISVLLACTIELKSQECVQCDKCVTTGNNASAIGSNNTASGNNSLAGGYYSQSTGSNSLAFGYKSKAAQSTTVALGNTAVASGTGSIAIGTYVKASAQNSFVFGAGATTSYPLTNSTPSSIAFGVNSNKPTMLITKSLNNNYTGKVAIGNVTPAAKLHIKSDNNENASIFIEPANKNNWKAYINLFDDSHSITVDNTATMDFNSGNGTMSFQGYSYCFGKNGEAKTRIQTHDKAAIYHNAQYKDGIESRDGAGPSYAIDFNDNGLQFRAANYQTPRSNEITNWRNTFSISVDGKIGIGSKDIYLHNNGDNQLTINSPKAMDLQSSNITLTGKIGINATNNVEGYALAVDGGIISNKVFIKEVNQWPDYVFSDEYQLMDLDELRNYLDNHKHLPGVPSQAEVIRTGYDINDMHHILLKKIEEMTRYILMLQDEINALKKKKKHIDDTIVFSYDNNGNRISRDLYFKRIGKPEQDASTLQKTPYELFPNPTSGRFSLIVKEPAKAGKIHAALHTMTGTTIIDCDIDKNPMVFDLSAYPSGIYILEIDGTEMHHTWKVIKQ